MNEFFYMGGYAFHVWLSYGLAFLVLLVNILGPSLKHKNNLQKASDFQLLSGLKSDDA